MRQATPNSPCPAGIAVEVRNRQVALLYKNAPLPIIANAVNGALLAYINTTLGSSAPVAVAWIIAMLVIMTSRLLLVRAYHQSSPSLRVAERWFRPFFVTTLLVGLTWSVGAFLFMWRAPEAIYLFSGVIIAGTAAGAIASLGPVLLVYQWFAILLLGSMSLAVLLNATTALEWTLGGMTLFFLVVLLRGANTLHQTITDVITLQLTQEATLSDLQHKEAALAASEQRYRLIVHHSPTGILNYDNDLVITYCNERFADILNTTKDKLIGLDMKKLNDQRILPPLRQALEGITINYEGGYKATMSGREMWVSMSCSALVGPDGKIDGGIAIVEDITARRDDEMALRESEARLLLMLETSPIAVRIAGNGGRKVLFANQRYADLIQARPGNMLNVDPSSYYVNPDEYNEILAVLEQGGQVTHRLLELKMPDGTPKWALGSYMNMNYRGEPATLGWFYDITQQKAAERQFEHMAKTDSLTSLNNRRSFMDIAEHELDRCKRKEGHLSIMMLDLDHFKSINDTHGHRTGDVILQTFGKLCLQTLRSFDTVGRLGGEEFAILLPDTSLEQAMSVAERLRQLVEHTGLEQERGLPIHFTVSVGVTATTQVIANIDTLLSQADAALYQAKRSGRNRVCAHSAPA